MPAEGALGDYCELAEGCPQLDWWEDRYLETHNTGVSPRCEGFTGDGGQMLRCVFSCKDEDAEALCATLGGTCSDCAYGGCGQWLCWMP